MHEGFKEKINEVRKIVNQYDPDGLVAIGAPEDEYDKYVSKIVSLYNSKTLTEEELKGVFPNALNYDQVSWGEMLKKLQEVLN